MWEIVKTTCLNIRSYTFSWGSTGCLLYTFFLALSLLLNASTKAQENIVENKKVFRDGRTFVAPIPFAVFSKGVKEQASRTDGFPSTCQFVCVTGFSEVTDLENNTFLQLDAITDLKVDKDAVHVKLSSGRGVDFSTGRVSVVGNLARIVVVNGREFPVLANSIVIHGNSEVDISTDWRFSAILDSANVLFEDDVQVLDELQSQGTSVGQTCWSNVENTLGTKVNGRVVSVSLLNAVDKNIESICRLEYLQHLELSGAITGSKIGELSRLKHLRSLTVRSLSSNRQSINGICKLNALTILDVQQFEGMSILDLKDFTQLQELWLPPLGMERFEGMEVLFSLPCLKKLILSGCDLDGSEFSELTSLGNVIYLDISSNPIENDCILRLVENSNVRKLIFPESAFEESEINELNQKAEDIELVPQVWTGSREP